MSVYTSILSICAPCTSISRTLAISSGPKRKPCQWCQKLYCNHCRCTGFGGCDHETDDPCPDPRYVGTFTPCSIFFLNRTSFSFLNPEHIIRVHPSTARLVCNPCARQSFKYGKAQRKLAAEAAGLGTSEESAGGLRSQTICQWCNKSGCRHCRCTGCAKESHDHSR